MKITEIGNYLVQANLKYLDGMSLVIESKTTNFLACFIVGRSLCQIGDYTQALIYLKNCINWSDLQLQSLARYFSFWLYWNLYLAKLSKIFSNISSNSSELYFI